MSRKSKSYLFVNFGGPRSKEEIFPFLSALLNDRDVIWSGLPSIVHRLLFTQIARRRAVKIAKDYNSIGGKSPIYEDTENLALSLRQKLEGAVYTFHRYLPATHDKSLENILKVDTEEIVVFPLFPQFSYATTGSIARFFLKKIPLKTIRKMRWVFSYATHEAYIRVMQQTILDFLIKQNLVLEETLLFFSAHGVPQQFICRGDMYQKECEESYEKIREAFPSCKTVLAYQSKFGKGEWIRPYTKELCENIEGWIEGYKNVIFVPLTFTSDHIETLFEVENEYLPPLRAQGVKAWRCPALNLREEWQEAIIKILETKEKVPTEMLLRSNLQKCCSGQCRLDLLHNSGHPLKMFIS